MLDVDHILVEIEKQHLSVINFDDSEYELVSTLASLVCNKYTSNLVFCNDTEESHNDPHPCHAISEKIQKKTIFPMEYAQRRRVNRTIIASTEAHLRGRSFTNIYIKADPGYVCKLDFLSSVFATVVNREEDEDHKIVIICKMNSYYEFILKRFGFVTIQPRRK